jgi:ComF family protein
VSAIATLGRFALDLVFPPRCVVCGRGDNFLCANCVADLPPADGLRCVACWQPRTRSRRLCSDCQARRPAFHELRTPYRYDGTAKDAVLALKFRGLSAAGGPMGELMTEFATKQPMSADVVVPVPLSRGHERSRGYNQSALLAGPIATALGVALDAGLLIRRRSTSPQARLPNRERRRANVVGAFQAAGRVRLQGLAVLLVDDVATTGATLDACAEALLAAGAARVDALAFARED